MKSFVSLLATLSVLLSQHALASEPLTATLEARKVVRTDDGNEQLISATEAKPGDVLEYRVTYRNVSNQPLRDVMAMLPVPATSVEYLTGSAVPSSVEASLNGVLFAPVPLKRLVKLSDGKHQQQLVPTIEYRFLRWPLGDLSAGGSKTVRARVRVVTELTLAAEQK